MSEPRRGVCAAAYLAALVACSGGQATPTQVVVVVDAEPCVAAEARAAEVRVLGDDGRPVLERRVSLDPATGDGTTLPLRVPIVPVDGDASRRFWVDAVLLDDAGDPIGAVRVAGRYVEDELVALPACLGEACVGVDCGVCRPVPTDGAPAGCATCSAGTCGSATVAPMPFTEGLRGCPSAGGSCPGLDGGAHDAGPGVDAGPPTECAGDGECDDADGCTVDRCAGDVCVHEPIDGDGDGHVPTGCGGDDCDDGASGIHPGASEVCGNGVDEDCDGSADDGCCVAEDCDNGVDDDCDGAIDCFDLDHCRFDPACQARRCHPTDARFRWCAGECVNTYTEENHCGSCFARCLNDRMCTTTGLDGRPRCYCTSDADCSHGVNCNEMQNRCGCNADSCGAGAHCAPGGGFPAYCEFDVP